MRTALTIGGPLIFALTTFSIWSGIISFGEQIDGLEHQAGAQPGGTFLIEHEETYQCDENGGNCVLVDTNTEFGEIEGLELEETPIEYREGDEIAPVRKLNGLNKYANINFRWPTGIDENWRFVFEDKCSECGEGADIHEEPELNFGEEMIEIEPPTLVLPAN